MNFRPYRSRDISLVVDLLNLCFPGRQINQSSFIWKHFDPFFYQETVSYVAEDKGKIVCFVCFVPIKIKGLKLKKFYSCAVQATHPHYRRRGLTKLLTQIVESKLSPTQPYLGFSNDQGVQIDRHSHTINYSIVGQFSTRYLLPSFFPTSIYFQATDLPKIFHNFPNFSQIYQNHSYINWRFSHNPKSQYIFYSVLNKGQNIGTIICREKMFRTEITQINLSTADPQLWCSVISGFTWFELKKGKFISSFTYLNNHFWNKVFPSKFLQKNIEIYLTLKNCQKSSLNKNHWLLQGGDIQ